MVAMVAPCLLWSIASTCACFESVRRVLFDGSFLRDMVRILVGLKRPLRRHHRSPAQAMEPAGRDPGRAFGAPRSRTSDALFPEEVQSFPDNFSARLGHGSERHLRILFGLRRHQAPSPPKPLSGTNAGGAGSRMGPNRPLSRRGASDAPIAAEVHSFLR